MNVDYSDASTASEQSRVKNSLKKISENVEEVPIIIGNEKFTTSEVKYQVMVRNKTRYWKLKSYYFS